MHANLAIARAPFEPRSVSLGTYAFAVLVVLMSTGAFFFLFAEKPTVAVFGATPSPRGNPVFVGLWVTVYCIAMIVWLRVSWRRGLALRALGLVLFGGYVMLSTLWGYDPGASVVYAGMFGLNIVIAAALADTASPRVMLSAISWTIVALGAISLLLLIAAPETAVSTPERSGLLMRGELVGVFSHKTGTGLYSSLGLLILIFVDRSRWLWRAMGMAVLTMTMLLSNSMSAVVGFAIIAPVLFWANRAGPLRNYVIGTAAALAIIVSVGFPFFDFSWLSEELGRGANLTGRAGLWKMGIGFATERPFFGFGFQSFFDPTPFSRVWALRATEWNAFLLHFHNTVLQTWIDLGLVGVLAYLAILVSASSVFLNKTMDPRVSGTLAALLIFLTITAAADATYMAYNSLPTILLFYVFLVAGRNYGENRTDRARAGALPPVETTGLRRQAPGGASAQPLPS